MPERRPPRREPPAESYPVNCPITPVFAVARTIGWVAHWNEMIADPETRIFRPRQLYMGPTERPLVPMSERAVHQPLVG
jgi:citrate synthase